MGAVRLTRRNFIKTGSGSAGLALLRGASAGGILRQFVEKLVGNPSGFDIDMICGMLSHSSFRNTTSFYNRFSRARATLGIPKSPQQQLKPLHLLMAVTHAHSLQAPDMVGPKVSKSPEELRKLATLFSQNSQGFRALFDDEEMFRSIVAASRQETLEELGTKPLDWQSARERVLTRVATIGQEIRATARLAKCLKLETDASDLLSPLVSLADLDDPHRKFLVGVLRGQNTATLGAFLENETNQQLFELYEKSSDLITLLRSKRMRALGQSTDYQQYARDIEQLESKLVAKGIRPYSWKEEIPALEEVLDDKIRRVRFSRHRENRRLWSPEGIFTAPRYRGIPVKTDPDFWKFEAKPAPVSLQQLQARLAWLREITRHD